MSGKIVKLNPEVRNPIILHVLNHINMETKKMKGGVRVKSPGMIAAAKNPGACALKVIFKA